MTGIDSDVQSLISVLLDSPLAPLGQLVIDRLIQEEALRDFSEFEDTDRASALQPARELETARQRAFRQLDLAHRTITDHLKRRILISERLRELGPQLGIDSLIVLSVPDASEFAAPRPQVDLMAPGREPAFAHFLEAWNGVQSELRQRWERSSAG